MNVWNKVFLGVIIVTSVVVVALAAVEFHIRNTGQRHVNTIETRIEEANNNIARVRDGTAPAKPSVEKSLSELSFEELRGVLNNLNNERGTAWFGSKVHDIDERTLPPALQQVVVQVIITGPFVSGEMGIATNVAPPEALRGIVYAFKETVESDEENAVSHPSSFLGRFTVEGTPVETPFIDDEGNQKSGFRITLVTADPINDEEIDKIFGAGEAHSRWAIYTRSPVDRISGIFDQLTEEEMQAIPAELRDRFQPRSMPELTREKIETQIRETRRLLESQDVDWEGIRRSMRLSEEKTVQELRRYVQESVEMLEQAIETWEQEQNRNAVWEKYRERMDDPEADSAHAYSTMLSWLYQQRSSLNRTLAIAQSEIGTFREAMERIVDENEKIEADGDLEEKRRAAMEVQRDAVKKLLEEYEAEINRIQLQIEKLQAMATALVARIAEIQLKVVEKIEEEAAGE